MAIACWPPALACCYGSACSTDVYLVLLCLVFVVVVIVAVLMAKNRRSGETFAPPSTDEILQAGWYPEDENMARYWDGHKWLGEARNTQAAQ